MWKFEKLQQWPSSTSLTVRDVLKVLQLDGSGEWTIVKMAKIINLVSSVYFTIMKIKISLNKKFGT